MRGKITIKGALCNAQARTDTVYRARAGCVELQRHCKRLGIDGFAPSTFPGFCRDFYWRRFEVCFSSLSNTVSRGRATLAISVKGRMVK
jgi:hypothetical protein